MGSSTSDYLTPDQRADLVERALKRMESDERMKMMAAQMRAIASVAGQETMTENVYDLWDGINRIWIEAKLEQQLGEPPLAEPAPPALTRPVGVSLPVMQSRTEVEDCALEAAEINRRLKLRESEGWHVMAILPYLQGSRHYGLLVFNRLDTKQEPATG